MADQQHHTQRPQRRGPAHPAEYLLGVDVGGSGVRAGLFALDGALHAVSQQSRPAAGEQFNPQDTWRAVRSVLRQLPESRARVSAVGITAHLATVLTDPAGRPTTSAMLWRDNRAQQDAEDLDRTLGAALTATTGRAASGENPAARLRMLARTSPAVLDRTRWLLSLKDYLVWRLTGEASTDPASASYTQLFDVRRRGWSQRLAGECGIAADRLPPVLAATAQAGTISRTAAAVTGLAAGLPVAVGAPDGSSGALGAGAVRPGLTVDVAGTTDVLLHVTDQPPEPPLPGIVLNAYLLDRLWALGGPTGLTGGALDWLAVTLGYPSVPAAYQALGPELDAADPGDLMVRTTLTGRRVPSWDVTARGRIEGLTPTHRPAHLMRAAEEGGVFEVRLVIDALEAAGTSVSEVIMAGRPATMPRAAQVRADAWGIRVGRDRDGYASMRGAALAAAVAAGYFRDAHDAATAMVAPPRWHEPQPAETVAAEKRYQRWRTAMAPG